MKEYLINTCHINDFVAHKGWWAIHRNDTFDLESGEQFKFLTPGYHPAYQEFIATCSRIVVAEFDSIDLKMDPQFVSQSFIGYRIILYQGWFKEPEPGIIDP